MQRPFALALASVFLLTGCAFYPGYARVITVHELPSGRPAAGQQVRISTAEILLIPPRRMDETAVLNKDGRATVQMQAITSWAIIDNSSGLMERPAIRRGGNVLLSPPPGILANHPTHPQPNYELTVSKP
jgi:hypothetical protein